MNGVVKPDKEVQKAFRKMVQESAKEQNSGDLPYVKATSEKVEEFFGKMSLKQRKYKIEVDDSLKTY